MKNEDFIKQFNYTKLCDSKEFKSFYPNKKLKDREIYWTWTGLIYTFDYLCPKTYQIGLKEFRSGFNHHKNTNAIREMYLLPKDHTL